jgi:hypothetical protein
MLWDEVKHLRGLLAAVEKERDEAADSYEITLARMAENCTERQGERDTLSARVAQLEGALGKVIIIAHDYRIYDIEVVARAGLDGKEGNRG